VQNEAVIGRMNLIEGRRADVTGGCWPLLTIMLQYRDWEISAFCYWQFRSFVYTFTKLRDRRIPTARVRRVATAAATNSWSERPSH